MTPEVKDKIDSLVKENKVLVDDISKDSIFHDDTNKGSKLMPMCGFSNNVVQILNSLGVSYETVDVLEDNDIRQGIKEYSNWPTIPQVYINGEFIGGSDVAYEMYQKGELQQMLEVALAS